MTVILVTDLSDANKIIVHYADGSKDYFKLSESSEGLSNVKEYTVTDLGIKYTPNIVQKDHSSLINGIVDILKPIELQSDPIYQNLVVQVQIRSMLSRTSSWKKALRLLRLI